MLKQCSIHTERVLYCNTSPEFCPEPKVWARSYTLPTPANSTMGAMKIAVLLGHF